MSKKLVKATLAVLVAIAVYASTNCFSAEPELTDLQRANIEALAETEIDVVSCIKENGSICVIIVDGVVVREYKNKTKDRRH